MFKIGSQTTGNSIINIGKDISIESQNKENKHEVEIISESEIKYYRGQVSEIILTEDDIDSLRMNGVLQIDGIKIKKEKTHYKFYCNECGKVFPEDNKLDYRCDVCGGYLNSQEL